MSPQYTVKGSCLVQCPGMDEPEYVHGSIIYNTALTLYEKHLASLLTLPCPAKPDSWKEDDVKVEGVDFRTEIMPVEGWTPSYNNPDDPPTERIAIPIVAERKGEDVKFYVVEYSGFWNIQTTPHYDGKNILDAEAVGEKEAERYANIIAELLNKHYGTISK